MNTDMILDTAIELFNGAGTFTATRREARELIETAVTHSGEIKRWEGWADSRMSEMSYLAYRDIQDAPPGASWEDAIFNLYRVPHTGFSDYSGDTVERSNCRVLEEEFGDLIGIWLWTYSGGYGTHGFVWSPLLAYRWAIEGDVTGEEREEALDRLREWADIFEGLDGYHIVNEDDLSTLETELEDEAWEDWVRADVKTALGKLAREEDERAFQSAHFKKRDWPYLRYAVEEALETWLENENGDLRDLFHKAMDAANESPAIEIGGSVYYDLDKIVPDLWPLVRPQLILK